MLDWDLLRYRLLAAYLSLKRGWISGMSYLLRRIGHQLHDYRCVKFTLCSLAIGGNEYDFCVHWRCLHDEKAIAQYRMLSPSVVDVSTLELKRTRLK